MSVGSTVDWRGSSCSHCLGQMTTSAYTQAGGRVAHLAMCGIRLVVEEFRTDATKTKKHGAGGAAVDYSDTHDPAAAIKWLWRSVPRPLAGSMAARWW